MHGEGGWGGKNISHFYPDAESFTSCQGRRAAFTERTALA